MFFILCFHLILNDSPYSPKYEKKLKAFHIYRLSVFLFLLSFQAISAVSSEMPSQRHSPQKITSFMVSMPMDNPERSVDLFDEHEAHELVRVGQFAEGDVLVGAGQDGLAEAERAADDEDDVAFAGGAEFVDFVGEFHRIVLFALDRHREDVALFRDFGEDFFALFVLDHFHLFIAQVFGRFFVPDFDDLQLAVAAEPLCVFGDALLQIFLLQFSHRNDFYVHCFSLLFLLNYYPMGTSAISQPSFF